MTSPYTDQFLRLLLLTHSEEDHCRLRHTWNAFLHYRCFMIEMCQRCCAAALLASAIYFVFLEINAGRWAFKAVPSCCVTYGITFVVPKVHPSPIILFNKVV